MAKQCAWKVRKFLGVSSYYRRFICKIARIAQPLHDLTCKGASFEWSTECEEAFKLLKGQLVTPPVLVFLSFDVDFTLERCINPEPGSNFVLATARWQASSCCLCQPYPQQSWEELQHNRTWDSGCRVGYFSFYSYLYGNRVTRSYEQLSCQSHTGDS